jgi:hypothetical protein
MRKGEILGLKWEQVNFEQELLLSGHRAMSEGYTMDETFMSFNGDGKKVPKCFE